MPLEGNHELVGNDAVGAEQLGAGEAICHSSAVDRLAGGARGRFAFTTAIKTIVNMALWQCTGFSQELHFLFHDATWKDNSPVPGENLGNPLTFCN